MFDLQPDRQPDGKMDGRCWSSSPAYRDRPERRGRDRSCYQPELSPAVQELYRPELSPAVQEHALSIGCQLSVLAPPPERRALSPTAHSASLPALLLGPAGSGAPRSYWVLPKPKPDRRSTPARPSPTRTVAASAQPAVGAAGTAAAQRAPDARLGCGEDAAGLARKQSAVVARVPYLPVSPCNRVRVGGFGLRVTRLSTPPCPRLPQVPQVVTAAMRAHRQAAGVQERAAVLLL